MKFTVNGHISPEFALGDILGTCHMLRVLASTAFVSSGPSTGKNTIWTYEPGQLSRYKDGMEGTGSVPGSA